jgi:hypothetical protein
MRVLRFALATEAASPSLPLLKQLQYGYSCVGEDVGLFGVLA